MGIIGCTTAPLTGAVVSINIDMYTVWLQRYIHFLIFATESGVSWQSWMYKV